MAISRQDNKTRHSEALRDSLEHVLNFLATDDRTELAKAESAAQDAKALAYTRRETVAAKYLANMATSVGSDLFSGLAR